MLTAFLLKDLKLLLKVALYEIKTLYRVGYIIFLTYIT